MQPTPAGSDDAPAPDDAELTDQIVNLAFSLGLAFATAERRRPALAGTLRPAVEAADRLIHTVRRFALESEAGAVPRACAAAGPWTPVLVPAQPAHRPVPRRGSRYGCAGLHASD